ncbi:hypothetical protein HAX54_021478 [Datura stramonium]|uniref:Uncharacterized protein n=1 Tax=Datura stramonium TaxID=4076 RepID=A0ABS8UUU8_DATST|nr:hypothetical protein [Datura stramonium]
MLNVVSDEGKLSDTSKVEVLQQRKLIDNRDTSSMLKPSIRSPPKSLKKSTFSAVQSKANLKNSVTVILSYRRAKALKKPLPEPASITTEKSPSNQVTASATAERPISRQVSAQSRPLSAPLVTKPRPAALVVSIVQATQLLPCSVRS